MVDISDLSEEERASIEDARVALADAERLGQELAKIMAETGRHPASLASTLCVLTGEMFELQDFPTTLEDETEMARWRQIGRQVMRKALDNQAAAAKKAMH